MFIANNAVHEYISQGMVTETLSASAFADVKRAGAAAAKADADVNGVAPKPTNSVRLVVPAISPSPLSRALCMNLKRKRASRRNART